MRGVHKVLPVLVAAALLAACLGACGSSDSTGSSTSTAATGGSAAGTSEKGSSSFIVPGGDNSIQNYGNEADPGERRAAEAALFGYLQARAGGDWGTACTYLSSTVKGLLENPPDPPPSLAGKSCAAILAKLIGSTPVADRKNTMTSGLASLRSKGETGFGLYHGSDGTDYTIAMANEHGGWKVASLAPSGIDRGPGG